MTEKFDIPALAKDAEELNGCAILDQLDGRDYHQQLAILKEISNYTRDEIRVEEGVGESERMPTDIHLYKHFPGLFSANKTLIDEQVDSQKGVITYWCSDYTNTGTRWKSKSEKAPLPVSDVP